MNLTPYENLIRPLLSDGRFYHSQCVSRRAGELAEQYGADQDKAQIAGILHDIMKDIPKEKQRALMKKYGIILTPIEENAPKLWHAMLGAAYLKNEKIISDPEILDAVRYHISDDRDYKGVEQLRKAAEKDLDETLLEGMVFTIRELSEMCAPIHPDTIAAYNEIALSRMKKNKKEG
jgi:putative nucleotidyltransferase with HDIG domain